MNRGGVGNLKVTFGIDVDGDGDGYGADVDCNDSNTAIHPGATEICNGIDDNCVGGIDNGLTFANYYTDADSDSYGATSASPQNSCSAIAGKVTNNTDCNDGATGVNPGATETCNGIDDNCGGGID